MGNPCSQFLVNTLHKAFLGFHFEQTLHHRVQPTVNHTSLQPVIQGVVYLPLLLELRKGHTCVDGSLQSMRACMLLAWSGQEFGSGMGKERILTARFDCLRLFFSLV